MPNIKIEWHEIEKLPNGARYRKFVNGKPTNGYKLVLGADPSIDEQVGASADDCLFYYNAGSPTWSTTSIFITAGWTTSGIDRNGGGMRFTSVDIPQGATINTAKITFRCGYATSGTVCRTRFRGEDIDDAAAFSTQANYLGRDRTSAYVDWDGIPAWIVDTNYESPEIKTVVQEIVNRGSWASGNDMVIFWDDHEDRSDHNNACERWARSYDGSTTYAPKIHIEYTEGGAALEKNLIDAVAIADSITKTTGLNKADTVTIADSISKLMRLIKADIATIVDSISKAVGLIKADTITIADAIAKAVSLVKTDTVIIVDTFTKIVSYIRSLVDSVGITDSISKTVSIVKADTVAITETMAAVRGKVINLFDTVTIADTMTTVLSAGAIILKQSIARMQIKGLDIARMSFKKMGIAKMPLYRWITRRWTA